MYGNTGRVLFQKVNGKKLNRKLRRNEQSSEVSKDYYEEEPFQSTRLLLGLYGAIPFTWSEPHTPSLHPVKSTFIFAFITIIVLGFVEYHLIVVSHQRLAHEKLDMKDAILVLELEFFSFFYFVNFAVWSDVSAAKQIVAKWIRLQKLCQELTGRQLVRNRRALEKPLNFFLAVFPYICCTLAKVSNAKIQLRYSFYPVITQAGTIVMTICFLWIAYFSTLGKIATLVNAYLLKDLNNNVLTSQKLRRYREIWLQMRSISDSTSSFSAPIFILVLSVALIVFFIYEITILFRLGEVFSVMAHAIICISLVFLLTYMASATSSGIGQIKEFYDTILAREGLFLMSNTEQREVIGIYLSQRTRTPIPTYGGFVVVNKALLSSVLAAVATYLVVLVQFSYSMDKINRRSNTYGNSTV